MWESITMGGWSSTPMTGDNWHYMELGEECDWVATVNIKHEHITAACSGQIYYDYFLSIHNVCHVRTTGHRHWRGWLWLQRCTWWSHEDHKTADWAHVRSHQILFWQYLLKTAPTSSQACSYQVALVVVHKITYVRLQRFATVVVEV